MTLIYLFTYLDVFSSLFYFSPKVVSGARRWRMSLIPPSAPICARSLINRGIWWFWRGMPAAPWGAANSVLGQALAPHI